VVKINMEKERELAIRILDEFEEMLEKYNIDIPEEDREGNEGEARIYGRNWYFLEDAITELIKTEITKWKKNKN